MAHGITEHDIGFCKGSTWHNLPQYAQLDRAVTIDEALSCFEFEATVEKVPNIIKLTDENGEESYMDSGSFSIIRKDINKVLNPAVGNQYTLCDMTDISKLAYSQVVEAFNDSENEVEIETVGTLSAGAIQFLSLSFDTHKVYGDESETTNRLMVTNDLSGGGIQTLVSQIRTVCKNTRAWAIEKAKQNGNWTSTRHTKNCNDTVKSLMINMAQVQVDMLNQREMLDKLSKADAISTANQNLVLDAILPVKKDSERKSPNIDKRDAIKTIFYDGQDGLDGKYSKTPYAFLNAITNYYGNDKGREGQSVDWDNIAGRRAKVKENAISKLVELTL